VKNGFHDYSQKKKQETLSQDREPQASQALSAA